MNRKFIAMISAAGAFAGAALGQGAFQNLDFEAARIVPPHATFIDATSALPGWSAFSWEGQLSEIAYNLSGAIPPIQLFGSNPGVIGGNFSVGLNGSGSGVSQTGLVPAGTQMLFFKASWPGSAPLIVSLAQQDLPYTAISSGPNYTLYGADVSAFAGQTATLTFLASAGGYYVIDDIEFAVPEPSTFEMLSLGALLLGMHRIRKGVERGQSMVI